MTMLRITIAALLLLAGCVIRPQPVKLDTFEAVAAHTQAERDDFERTLWVKGPSFPITYGGGWMVTTVEDWGRLRTLLHTDSEQPRFGVHQLAVATRRSDWSHWDRAADENGVRLSTVDIGSDATSFAYAGTVVVSCYEATAIELPDDWLRAAAGSGIKLQLAGSGDKLVIDLPAHYIQAHLRAVENAMEGKPVGAVEPDK